MIEIRPPHSLSPRQQQYYIILHRIPTILEEFQAQNVELLQYCRELEAKVDAVIEWKGDKIAVAPHITGRPL